MWLTQVEQRFSAHGMDSHSATALMVYLYHSKVLSAQSHYLSSFQTVLKFIGETDFRTLELDLSNARTNVRTQSDGPSAGSLLIPVEDGFAVNMWWRISKSSLAALQQQARRSLSLLQSGAEDAFHAVFMTRRDFFQNHNLFFHFPVPRQSRELSR